MTRKINIVDMDALSFTSDGKSTLKAEGVTTCIALVVRGNFWDEDDNYQAFCGLYHWSGFPDSTQDYSGDAKEVLNYFFNTLRDELELDEEDRIDISQLVFIGGERPEYDENNELILSGTEKEVNALRAISSQYNFNKHHIKIAPSAIEHIHYLTHGEQSLSISVDVNSYSYDIETAQVEQEEPDSLQYLSFLPQSASGNWGQ